MGSKHKTLDDLFHHQVKDLFDAERHAGRTLSKMAKATGTEALRTALERRHDDVAVRMERLEAVFDAIDRKAHGVPCEAMQGLVDETKALVEDFADGPALDDGLIAAAQAIEHYAIARYTALRLWAGRLGLGRAGAAGQQPRRIPPRPGSVDAPGRSAARHSRPCEPHP